MNRSGSDEQLSSSSAATTGSSNLQKGAIEEKLSKQHGQEASVTTGASAQATVRDMEKVAPDNWIDRNPELVRLTGPHPFNAEPPMEKLMAGGLVTPTALHYVRNHGTVPKLEWSSHRVTVDGLVKTPKSFTMDQLAAMPSITVTVTFNCDGNRRKEINMIKRSGGFNWGSGGVGTAVWKGVPLHHVLTACGVDAVKGRYLHFEGTEDLVHGKYATSIPLAVAMDPMSDTMLAYEMNGDRLPPDHGFPVRVILPGFVGGRNVKWLAKLTVSEVESTNYYHLHDNKLMPPQVDVDTPPHAPVFKDPRYVLYDMNINSVIASPFNEQFLHFDNMSHTDTIKVTGYAYSGGGRPITRVELSLNDGKSWSLAELKFPETAFNHNGAKCYTWCHWHIDVPVWKLLQSTEMVVRAFDTSSNTQPAEPTWNLLGMMNNAWYRVKIDAKNGGGNEIIVVFRHPVELGNHAGGWMIAPTPNQREDLAIKPVLSLPWGDVAAAHAGKLVSMEEVEQHNKEDDCWIVIDRQVIDVSSYMHEHPGSKAPLLLYGGKDVSQIFHDIHARDAYEIMTRYMIGTVSRDKHLIAESSSRKRAINPRHWVSVKLIEKEQLTHDTCRFRFELPNRQKMGLPVGQHVLIGVKNESKMTVRPYTPVRPIGDLDDDGTFDIVFKLYQVGEMSTIFSKLTVGDSVLVKGPAGHIIYQGNGIVHVTPDSYKVNQITMIAGGTGITPMYQLIQAIVNENSNVKLSLLYANKTVEDIILKDELDNLAMKHPDKLTIWYTVDIKPKIEWKYGVGRIDERTIREHSFLPSEETIVFLCGPPAMLSRAAYPNLFNIGYTEESFEF